MMGAFYESSPSYGLATVESESSPWLTSQAPGASLEGTLGQQANESWGMGVPQPGNPFGLEDALAIAGQQQAPPDPIASLGAFQAQMVQSRQDEPPPIGSITRKADGTTDLKGVSSQFLEDVMGQMTDLKTMKAAAMARVAQLRQQEASGSPILDALSQFAGGMAANDPTMPGWVRALGATSLQMGNQGIERKRMAEEQKVLQLGQTQAQMARVLMEDQRAERQLGLQEKSFEATQEAKKATLIEARVKDVLGRYKDEVDKGRPIDPMLIATELVEGGLSKERAIAAATQMQKQAETNKAEIEAVKAADIRDKAGLEAYKSSLALRNDLTVQGRKEAAKLAELNFGRQTELEKISAASAAKVAGERKLPGKARETLIQINALDEKLDNLLERAKKFPMTTGPVMGRVGTAMEFAAPDSQFAAERRAIRSEFERFVAQYVKAVQGGGNTISNKDIENAAKALPNMKLSLGQMEELMNSIKNEGQYQRDVMRVAYEADWDGKDRNLLGGKADDTSIAKAAKVGSVVTINGAQYRKTGANDYEPVQVK